jgi:hypothetical protein
MRIITLGATAALALAGAIFVAPAAHAATTSYSDGDLFLGFRATGGSQDYLIDIGQVDQFLNNPAPFTLSLGNIGADLTSVFGSNWYTRTDLFYSVIGGSSLGLGADPANTLYATKLTGVWTRKSDGSQASTTSLIAAMGNAYDSNTSTVNSPFGLIQTASSSNAYATYQPGGTIANSGGISFNAFNPSNEANPSQAMALERLTSTANPAGQTDLGGISIGSDASVQFVPEPGSIGLLTLGAGLLGFVRPRSKNIPATA